MESTFAIIAEPNRRAILSLLASSERSVSELERKLRMPQPLVSKHLRILRDAGFVEARVDAQRRVYRLRPEPLMPVSSRASSSVAKESRETPISLLTVWLKSKRVLARPTHAA